MTLVSPESRFRRTVARLARCRKSAQSQLQTDYASHLTNDEAVLGIYEGYSVRDEVVFTNKAFVFVSPVDDKIKRVEYALIQTVYYPMPASESVDLLIQLTTGYNETVRIVGRDGSFRDVFEVGRYLMRIAEDQGRGQRLSESFVAGTPRKS